MNHGFHACFFQLRESKCGARLSFSAIQRFSGPGTGQSRRAEELRRSGAGAIVEPSHRAPQCALQGTGCPGAVRWSLVHLAVETLDCQERRDKKTRSINVLPFEAMAYLNLAGFYPELFRIFQESA
jgi:hypothetical protein